METSKTQPAKTDRQRGTNGRFVKRYVPSQVVEPETVFVRRRGMYNYDPEN